MDPDGLGGISDVKKSELVDATGRRFHSLRASWTPRFGLVWLHILCGYIGLGTIGWLCWQPLPPPLVVAQIAAGALGFGYVHAYMQLFIHEAAHYNICPARLLNDRIANCMIGAWIGLSIEAYRPIHFDHHRHLGTTRDTERSYFSALSVRLLIESITGIHALRVLLGRLRDSTAKSQEGNRRNLLPLVQGLVMHSGILLFALHEGRYSFTLAWVLGVATGFPFFATIRQLLEHRSLDARPDTNYAEEDHGEVNRLFGTGPLASTLGGAGFNRHLLHHWEPQLSYTRLPDLERFLMGTQMAPSLEAASTTYAKTFLALLRTSRAHESS